MSSDLFHLHAIGKPVINPTFTIFVNIAYQLILYLIFRRL
jgi:hypothetical protein